jgi:uncharacterized membrane protein
MNFTWQSSIVKRLKPERIYLVIAGTFGLAALFANAPFQAPDEGEHYARMFQLSEGVLIGERYAGTAGGELPQPAIDVINLGGTRTYYEKKMTHDLFAELLHPAFVDWSRAPRAYHDFRHSVLYSPAGYLPQTLVVFLGRHLRVGPLGIMYLARLAGFAASLALGYAALKTLPIYRWTTLVLLLCPMSLYLLGSLAPDGMLITGSTLLMARLVRLVVQKDRPVDSREQAIVLVLAGLLALAKFVFLPFAGVAALLIYPRLGSLRSKAIFGAAVLVCCVLPVWYWGRVTVALFVPGRIDFPIDPVMQARHLVGAPLAFMATLARTIHVRYPFYLHWMVGMLGRGDTPMPGWFYPAFGIGLIGCLILESGGAQGVGWGPRVVMIAAAAASVLLIFAAQYVSWTATGSLGLIEGVQGRYFLPLAPLVILSFPRILATSAESLAAALASVQSVLWATVCLLTVIFRYYVPAPALPKGPMARLANISTFANVGTGSNVLTTEIVVSGHGLETLLIRADGASLAKLGVLGVLANPSLRVRDSEGNVLAFNTAPGTNSNTKRISVSSASVGAFQLPTNNADSGVVLRLTEGRYSIEVGGVNGTTGIVREEIYEISGSGTRLAKVSSRGFVGKGSNTMILGFVVGGAGTERLLCRAVGPSLAKFGVIGALSRPTLDIGPLPSGDLINSSWGTSPFRAEISSAASSVGAFPLAGDSADSAAIFSAPPGAYTMKVLGEGSAAGVAQVEIYELP